jgi:hypothetical protein
VATSVALTDWAEPAITGWARVEFKARLGLLACERAAGPVNVGVALNMILGSSASKSSRRPRQYCLASRRFRNLVNADVKIPMVNLENLMATLLAFISRLQPRATRITCAMARQESTTLSLSEMKTTAAAGWRAPTNLFAGGRPQLARTLSSLRQGFYRAL